MIFFYLSSDNRLFLILVNIFIFLVEDKVSLLP